MARARGRGGFPALLALAVLGAYAWTHAHLPSVPGNSAVAPAGWLAWADQGEYQRSAEAFAAGSLDPGSHTYPFLYALVASPWVRAFPRHPFAVVDAACLVAFTLLAFAVLAACLPRPLAALASLSGVLLPPVLLRQWVIPWTSTLAAVLLLLALYALTRALAALSGAAGPGRATGWCAVLGVASGLVIPTRPADGVAAAVPLLVLAGFLAREALVARRLPFGTALRCLLAVIGGAVVCAGSFPLFNLLVYGDVVSPYLAYNATVNGFSFRDLPEKAVSLLSDPGALYLAEGMSFRARMPVVVAGLLLVPTTLWRGPVALRTGAAMILAHLAVYFSYADLLPQGLFVYNGVHYFKWFAPLLAGIILWSARDALPRARAGRLGARLGLAVPLALLVLLLSVRFDVVTQPPSRVASRGGVLTVALARPTQVDLVDFVGVTPEMLGVTASEVYLDSAAEVRLGRRGGTALRYARGIRLIPGKDRIRLLFVDPVRARVLRIRLNRAWRLRGAGVAGVRVGTKKFAFDGLLRRAGLRP